MERERFAYLFQQYVNKNCSSEELDEFMAMVRDSNESDYLDIVLDKFWDLSTEVELDKDRSEEIFKQVNLKDSNQINKTLNNSFSKKLNHTIHKTPNKPFKIWLSWAATIAIIGISGFLLLNKQKKEVQAVAGHQNKPEFILKPSNSVIAKTLNEHQKITLPDGSTVILNNNSSITYPRDFKSDKREVVLIGEGYFDIKHDDKKSFTVYTGKIKTTVLGTAFNIKAYEKDKNITVTVTRGKVSVLGDKTTLGIITPNQQIVFNKEIRKSNLSRVIAKNSIQWQETDLFFDDISMEQAAQILSAHFNTPINFSTNEAKRCRFTATFLKGESLDEILKIICSYNNAQYLSSASGITINGKGCE